ncbi:MAG: redoxin domain-containing protein [Acidobacteria bacterium]|nr:redoxin domain-containing protein [Acidobacteriota bacterium]
MKFLSITLLFLMPCATFAQSGRLAAGDPASSAAPDRSVKELFEEANGYFRTKAAEYDAKKIAPTPERIEQVRREQRELAARYAAEAEARKTLTTDDRYYIGMLHWIAVNLDGTVENLSKYVAAPDADPERAQKARYTIVVSLAKQHKTGPAESLLTEYLGQQPLKASEHWRMDVELAKAYEDRKEFTKMLPHASQAFTAGRLLLGDPQAADLTIDHVVDTGILAFDAYGETGQQDRAEGVLDDLRALGVSKSSPSLFYYAVDQKIRYLIETGRKDKAMTLYAATMASISNSFPEKAKQDYALQRFKDRRKTYELLGVKAPEFTSSDQLWFPGSSRSIDDLKGKVVMLDFWATWCGPCVEAVPEMKELNDQFSSQGLMILGLTRYYGESYGMPKDRDTELAQVKAFREKKQIPWDFVVANGQQAQILYGAMLLPTTVLIDRKGIVRYVATGTNSQRSAEVRRMVEKLISEK